MTPLWPQYLVITLHVLNFFMVCYLHGTPKTEPWDVRTTMLSSFIGIWILWMGGFFAPLSAGAP